MLNMMVFFVQNLNIIVRKNDLSAEAAICQAIQFICDFDVTTLIHHGFTHSSQGDVRLKNDRYRVEAA